MTIHACILKKMFFVLMLPFLITLPALAQNLQSGLAPTLPSASAASYYYIAKPGELTMQVNLWGFVKNPGRYEVPSSTDLIQLISFAGGPVQYAKLDEVKLTRMILNDTTGAKQEIILNLEHLDKLKQSSLALYPGDTIFIDHTGWLTLRDVFSFVTTAAVITSAVAQILWASRR
jgi:NADH:ubiquinone oxidoreductase subunit F (NADH-binding)